MENHSNNSEPSPSSGYGMESSEVPQKEPNEKSGLCPNNDRSYSDLITKTYAKEEISKVLPGAFRSEEAIRLAGYQLYLKMLDQTFPVECLRSLDSKRVYAVYKTNDGGLIYVFFSDRYDAKGEYGDFVYTHSFYWPPDEDVSAYRNKKNVKLDEAAKTDEILSEFLSAEVMTFNTCIIDDINSPVFRFVTLHPTKKGFVQVIYKIDGKEPIDSKTSAKELKEHSFSVSIKKTSSFVVTSQGEEFDCSILKQDYLSQ